MASGNFEPGRRTQSTNNGIVRLEQSGDRLVAGKGLHDQLLIGYDDNGVLKVRLVKEGADVFTAEDKDAVFDSGRRMYVVALDDFTDLERRAGISDIVANIPAPIGAQAFFGFVSNPAASPALKFQTPRIIYDQSNGTISGLQEMYYDPALGVIKIHISCRNSLNGSAEKWRFHYTVAFLPIPA